MFCILCTLFFPFDIAANQTAYHLSIYKAYTGQAKNAPNANFSQLNQPAQNAAMRRKNHAAMRQAGKKTPPKAHQTMTDGKAHPTVEKAHQWKSSPYRWKSSPVEKLTLPMEKLSSAFLRCEVRRQKICGKGWGRFARCRAWPLAADYRSDQSSRSASTYKAR